MDDLTRMTARRLLETWGLLLTATAAVGSPVARLRRLSGMADTGPADSTTMVAAARYVEGTFNYWGAKPVLAWRYAMGNRDFDAYPFRRPGEPYAVALTRHGLGQELLDAGLPARLAPWQVHDRFVQELEYRIEAEGAPVVLTLAPKEEPDAGPTTPGERAQFALLEEIRAAMARLDWSRARELHGRLVALRHEAAKRSA
ncbi:MAG: hypothetical protein ACO1SV_00910 [Fimbriimonas sp.]